MGLTTISEEVKRFIASGPSQLRFPFDNREHSNEANFNHSAFDNDIPMNIVEDPTTCWKSRNSHSDLPLLLL